MTNEASSNEKVKTSLTPTEKVNATLDERGVTMLPCSFCGAKDAFFLSDGYVVVGVTNTGNTTQHGGKGMPLLPLCCLKCGNTVFLNALLLGLGNNLFDKEVPDVSQ